MQARDVEQARVVVVLDNEDTSSGRWRARHDEFVS
jgi:hypothetical protein